MRRIAILIAVVLLAPFVVADEPLPAIPPIPRLLPPEGVELPEEDRAALERRLADAKRRLKELFPEQPELGRSGYRPHVTPDIQIFLDAVESAIRYDEFYDLAKDLGKARRLLDLADERIEAVEQRKLPWLDATPGLQVRGYRSRIDGSCQPYGIVFPKDFDPKRKKKYPLFVWLHGRGDKGTNLHFIHERLTHIGQLGAVDAVVLHPFGRQCVGFKSAGEIDVLEALDAFRQYSQWPGEDQEPLPIGHPILIGFSMGGAGAWHVGAHYGRFIAVAPGAGFAETSQYTKTDPKSVPWYERALWGCYDVPSYTRNLFNIPTIAYSGEKDKQIQAARIMEDAFRAEGKELTHLIGPGVEHRYEPAVLKDLLKRLSAVHDDLERKIANDDGSPLPPRDSYLQTRTLRYGYGAGSVQLLGLEQHWKDTRIDRRTVYRKDGEDNVLTTKNVTAFQIATSGNGGFTIDGQSLKIDVAEQNVATAHHFFTKGKEGWKEVDFPFDLPHKLPGLQGPIDDAFLEPFVVVLPTGKSKNPLVQRWVDFEIKHFVERWRTLMRGEPRMVNDTALSEGAGADDELFRRCNLICFGDPDSNQVIRAAFKKLPVTWKGDQVVAGKRSWPAGSHVPVLIYPDPFVDPSPSQFQRPYGEFADRHRYLVINSGLTFREAHDKTNSQQNPKLPDWAVIDLTQLPDAKTPGRIAAAGFFDEKWKWQENRE